MSRLKTYSFERSIDVLPGATDLYYAFIGNAGRNFKITSVTWTWFMRLELAPFTQITQFNIANQEIQLSLLNAVPVASPLTQPVQYVGAAPGANGIALTFKTPGKFNYTNMFVTNQISILINVTNRDVLLAIRYAASVIIEIDELE